MSFISLHLWQDALTKICSWEYVLCIDLWVQFISANIKENNLQGLSFSIIQVINGMVLLHPGSHYMPLKIRCIQWLNQLSSSSGMFIPVSSLVFDLLEYNTGKEGGKFGEDINFQKSLKVRLNDYFFVCEILASKLQLLSFFSVTLF